MLELESALESVLELVLVLVPNLGFELFEVRIFEKGFVMFGFESELSGKLLFFRWRVEFDFELCL